jgi:hypothetical protein
MREFILLFRSTEAGQREAMGTPERAQRSLQTWLAWIHELESTGHLKERGHPLDRNGRVVRGRDGVVTDGPFVEVKDIVLGFIMIGAADLDEAVRLASACPIVLGGGSVEIRPVATLPGIDKA